MPTPSCFGALFHILEAAGELGVGVAAARPRDRCLAYAGKVGDGEEQVAHLLVALLVVGGCLQLGELLVDLHHHRQDIRPVEADLGGALGELFGAGEDGSTIGTSSSTEGGVSRLAAFLARSSSFTSSQRALALPASRAACSPNTWGCRRPVSR